MEDPGNPTLVYRAIIDQLASRASSSVGAAIAKDRLFSETSDNAPFNELLRALSPSQRELLSRMLLVERKSAIHDALAILSWWVDCREVSLAYKGAPMQVDASGMGLHGDFIGRCSDWEWPASEA
jgi:hypothetical protein